MSTIAACVQLDGRDPAVTWYQRLAILDAASTDSVSTGPAFAPADGTDATAHSVILARGKIDLSVHCRYAAVILGLNHSSLIRIT